MKRFNTTGTCNPEVHYMVNIDRQVEAAAKLVRQGDYFCINRGRQYGKTTTLAALANKLSADFCVFNISFEGTGDSSFATVENACAEFLKILKLWSRVNGSSEEMKALLKAAVPVGCKEINTTDFTEVIGELCDLSSKPVVVMIDEVDQASNNDGFIKFLGVLRKMFLSRTMLPTFQSVVLAGVYDVKNLKLKMRSEDDHQYNSPWNIAVPFKVDMFLPADGIAAMLEEYKKDHQLDFDCHQIGQMIFDYTSGYPFLVSRICQIVDEEAYTWDKEGVLKAINALLKEGNTLFDDMQKKLTQFPTLSDLLKSIVFGGQRVSYNYYDRDINIASMFNFVTEEDRATKISCRIFETWLYDFFISLDKTSSIYQTGEYEKSQFIHDGRIDMRRLIERFCIHFNEIYRPGNDDKFVEDNGRKIFLTYLRPIINGVGNYYCEAQTRNLTRTDIIIDYLGQQYIIELKIWRGQSYNERGEQQLAEYLDYYHLQTGYMVSFCFNKEKQPGIKEVVVGDKKLIEAIV
ncbi:MAG: AAA-like domain-containing protein [Bacteroidaceae bacterium]|nr:AAA-like domain-containing protein [Bacteroidaceae bacterium]